MKSNVLVLEAERRPIEGVKNPGPHQIYCNPRLSIQSRELAELHPDEMRVKMIYAGLCGTDLHLIQTDPETGYVRCSAPARIPPEGRVIGHEGVGQVLEVGSHVRHVKPGAYVTFESIIVCHYCDVCRRGNFNQCRRARLLGLEKDGLFGDIVDVPSMLSHDVTAMARSEDDLKAAACIEPAGVAYVACRNTNIAAGDVVVVFGAGPIGVFAAMLSKTVFGASEVRVVDPVKFRRQLASRWCDRVYDVEEFFDSPPRFIDAVIEASGEVDNVNRILRRLNANGRIALLGRSGASLVLDDVDHMITNEISVTGSRGHLCGGFASVLSLYRHGRLPFGDIVTHVVDGLDGLRDLLTTPRKVLQENCKVLIRLDKERRDM